MRLAQYVLANATIPTHIQWGSVRAIELAGESQVRQGDFLLSRGGFDTLFADDLSRMHSFGTPTSQQLGSACRVLFDSPSQDLNFRALTPKAPEKSEEVLVPTAFRSPNSYRIKIDPHSPGPFKQQATQVNHLL